MCNKKLRCILLSLMVVAILITGCAKSDSKTKPIRERLISYEEEHALEVDIATHLKQLNLFYEDHCSVMVTSGYARNDDLELAETKTKIRIILDGRLANTLEEAESLADGYTSALMLYFGERDVSKYDIYVQFAGGFEFLNGKIIKSDVAN